MIRALTAKDRAQAEALWREIFEDTPAFTAYYFDKRFCPEHSFGAFDVDRLVAMALGRPSDIQIDGKRFSALLVAGVSTLPAYRKQGLMHRLMKRLIAHAKDSGFACCYLHPVNETLYTSLGFQNGTDAKTIVSEDTRSHTPFDVKDGTIWPDMLCVYQALLSSHNGMQVRDEAELKTVFTDYATENAKTLIAYFENRPVGYICYSGQGDVFELLATCANAYAFLIDEASRKTGRDLKAIVPTDCGLEGESHYSMQYLVCNDAFQLPLKNGFCCLAY